MTIVMYHYIRDLRHSRYPQIKGLDVEFFKKQIKYILKYYQVIKMQDLIAALKGMKKVSENSLLLTFDDAYKDHFDFVFPILDECGIQGSFFPPAKAIQKLEVLDVNKIHFILASVENKKLLIEEIYFLLDNYGKTYDLKSNKDYHNKLALQNARFDAAEVVFIKKLLQKWLPEKLRKTILDELFFKYVSQDEAVFSRELYMSVDQLKCMVRNGMYIGSHGWDHCWLNTLSEHQQENEIKLSLKFLRKIGSDTSEWAMCYPYGGYDDSVITLLKNHRCIMALTTQVGIANLNSDNPFTLPRIDTNDLPRDEYAKPNEWTLKIINKF